MIEALLVVDVQETFDPPSTLVDGIKALQPHIHTVASIELHDESAVPFERQLGWTPQAQDRCLVSADHVFVKHGYLPPPELAEYLTSRGTEKVYVCGVQAETCVLAAGFALFDAGLHPTLIGDLVAGSTIDPSGALGRQLWQHHFGEVIDSYRLLLPQNG